MWLAECVVTNHCACYRKYLHDRQTLSNSKVAISIISGSILLILTLCFRDTLVAPQNRLLLYLGIDFRSDDNDYR